MCYYIARVPFSLIIVQHFPHCHRSPQQWPLEALWAYIYNAFEVLPASTQSQSQYPIFKISVMEHPLSRYNLLHKKLRQNVMASNNSHLIIPHYFVGQEFEFRQGSAEWFCFPMWHRLGHSVVFGCGKWFGESNISSSHIWSTLVGMAGRLGLAEVPPHGLSHMMASGYWTPYKGHQHSQRVRFKGTKASSDLVLKDTQYWLILWNL